MNNYVAVAYPTELVLNDSQSLEMGFFGQAEMNNYVVVAYPTELVLNDSQSLEMGFSGRRK